MNKQAQHSSNKADLLLMARFFAGNLAVFLVFKIYQQGFIADFVCDFLYIAIIYLSTSESSSLTRYYVRPGIFRVVAYALFLAAFTILAADIYLFFCPS